MMKKNFNHKFIKCNIDIEIHTNIGLLNKNQKQNKNQYVLNQKKNQEMTYVMTQNGILKLIINENSF